MGKSTWSIKLFKLFQLTPLSRQSASICPIFPSLSSRQWSSQSLRAPSETIFIRLSPYHSLSDIESSFSSLIFTANNCPDSQRKVVRADRQLITGRAAHDYEKAEHLAFLSCCQSRSLLSENDKSSLPRKEGQAHSQLRSRARLGLWISTNL